MTENKQKVVSGISHLMMGTDLKKPALLLESPDAIA